MRKITIYLEDDLLLQVKAATKAAGVRKASGLRRRFVGAYGRSGPLPFGPLQGPGQTFRMSRKFASSRRRIRPGNRSDVCPRHKHLICFFKGLGHVEERLLAVPPSEIAIPSIVIYELEVGICQSAQPSKRRTQWIPCSAL